MITVDKPAAMSLQHINQNGNPYKMHEKLNTRRKYREWKGKNKLLFSGRIIGGSEIRKLFRTIALVGIPSGLFTIFVAGEYCSRYGEYHVVIVGAALALLSISSLLKTAFTDPGIIPRCSNRLSKDTIPPRYQDICLDGKMVRLKFCMTCKIIRPPRSYHCPICDNCVERFDHHCP